MAAGVTFLCTVYNKERFLPGVIEAIWRQAPDRPRQFVFVDDGSGDRSVAIVREMTREWPDCTIVEQRNGGPSSSTNTGIALARQPWLKLVGSDDILAPYATERLIAIAERFNAGGVFARSANYRDASEIAFDEAAAQQTEPWSPPDALYEMIRRGVSGTSPALLKTDIVQREGGCDPGVFVEDFSLALKVARVAPIVRWDHVVTLAPEDDTRITFGQAHQVHHDFNLALAHFVRDHPDLDRRYAKLAFRRAAGRARRFARRHGGEGVGAQSFWLNALSYFGPVGDPAKLIEATLPVYTLPGLKPVIRVQGLPLAGPVAQAG